MVGSLERCMQTVLHQAGIYNRYQPKTELCCRESAGHHLERSTCCVHPGPYHLPARSTSANRVPVGGSGALVL